VGAPLTKAELQLIVARVTVVMSFAVMVTLLVVWAALRQFASTAINEGYPQSRIGMLVADLGGTMGWLTFGWAVISLVAYISVVRWRDDAGSVEPFADS
jgi:EamA domain-containing membrane protein RarD